MSQMKGSCTYFPPFSSLQKLHISIAPLITENSLLQILKQASKLKNLHLYACGKVSPSIIETIASSCLDVEVLILEEIQSGFGITSQKSSRN